MPTSLKSRRRGRPARPAADELPAAAPVAGRLRKAGRWAWRGWRLGVRLCAFGILGGIALAAAGWVMRDRFQSVCLLFYLPLLFPGLAAVGFDVMCLGRALPKVRFGLAGVGLAAAVWGSLSMIGRGADAVPAAIRSSPASITSAPEEIRLVHWNVMWGGVRTVYKSKRDPKETAANWEALCREIRGREPDLVVLSEAPMRPMLDQLRRPDPARAGGKYWSLVEVENDGRNAYWYHLAVCSPWPLKMERHVPLENGHGIMVLAAVRGRPMRLLVVDGMSTIYQNRGPLLRHVARVVEESSRRGEPIDVVVGDFNATSRSVGFDAFDTMAGGYSLASQRCQGWRATFPAKLPLYDIDHVWLSKRVGGVSCQMLRAGGADHLGQFVRFYVPPHGVQ